MKIIGAEDVDRALDMRGLVEVLRDAFRAGAVQPVRHHHLISRPGARDTTLLLMPAWSDFARAGENEGFIGVKIVTVSPDNNKSGLPAVMGSYLLMDGMTGQPRALIDGQRLTLWRTACASALAADYLARADSRRLLMIGAGALAPFLIRAHRAVRPIAEVRIWNRTTQSGQRLVDTLLSEGIDSSLVTDLNDALGWADIISAATISTMPLVQGAHLRQGAHVDLVGAFSPAMRESDDETLRRADVFVDTYDGAIKEAGDIVQGLASGAISESDLRGDLFGLCRGAVPGRRTDLDITLFKSVGAAIEDLAAGIAVYRATSSS